jgi:hypothetical protein
MAEVKISALASATSLVGTEAVPVVQGGVTRRVRTSEIAELLQPAIDVVSTTLAAEVSARGADVKRLSDQISDIISAGGGAISVNSTDLSAVSAGANLHANAISINLDTEIANRVSAINVICTASMLNTAGVSVHGTQNVYNAFSNRISAVVAGAVSVTSAEVSLLQNTSVLNSAGNSIKGRQSVFNALSARIRDVEVHASAASDAATSANVHANAASGAATSIWNHIVSASVQSVGGTTSVKGGLQSVLNALSNRISAASTANTASVTSAELLSISVLNSAGASIHGLQSVVNAISGRIAGVIAGAVSINSTDLSAVSALAKQSISVVSAALAVEIVDRVSADALLLHRISVVSAAVDAEHVRASIAEKAFSDLLSNAAINTASALSVLSANVLLAHGFISTLSDAHTSLVNRVQALSATGGAVSANSQEISQRISLAVSVLNKASVRNTANVSVQGHQSVLNALSVKIAAGGGGGGSATSAEVLSAIATIATSAISVIRADLAALSLVVSALSTTVSTRTLSIAALSLAVSAAETHASTASTAATAADTHANAASDAATSVNTRATSLETRLSTLSALHQALSDVVSNALSAGDALSVTFNAISNKMSVISAGIGLPEKNVLANTATISASGLTKISGMSVTLVSTGNYEVKAVLQHSHSAANAFGFGVSGPVVTMATGEWRGYVSVPAESMFFGYFNQAGFGSITYSAVPTASATNYRTELNMNIAGATSGRLQLKARTSAAGVGAIDIRAGSYIRAYRI